MDDLMQANFDSCKKVCELCPGKLVGNFAIADYVLFAAVLVVSAGIGVFYMVREFLNSKKTTAEDVLMGGRDIGIFPIAMSLMASFMSAITVLGTPTEMYNNNTSYWIAGLAMIPTTIITNHVFLPFFHKLSLTSAYELAVSASIGLYHFIRELLKTRTSIDDVLMGGKNVSIFPVVMSLTAGFMSAITVLGQPTEMYNFNTSFWIAGLGMIPTAIITNHVFIPFFHKLNVRSAYEYLEKRFNRATRVCASSIFILNMLLYMGVVLYAPALALNQVTGLSLELSIVAIGVVCTFYTALGGLRAVVWTDTFQTFVVMAGLIAISVQGSKDLGGIDKVWQIADHGGRIFFIDWSPDPTTRHSVWALIIGSVVGQLTIYAANQTMIQRYLAIQDPANSQKALYVSLPLTLILSTLVCFVGIVIYATYHSCDPYILGHVHARDQLLPFLVMDKLTFLQGLPGLFVACLFSASLSSISSGLNALAIVILEDIVKLIWDWKDIHPSATFIARLAKVIGLLCGGVVIGVAFISQFLGQTVLQIMLSIFGMVGGPLLGLFISGLFIPFINSWGALCGLIVSAVLTFWVGIGGTVILPVPEIKKVSTAMCENFNRTCDTDMMGNLLNDTVTTTTSTIATTTAATIPPEQNLWIYHLSYLWYALFAVIISLITAFIVTIISSFLTEFQDPDNTDPRYIHRVADRVCCYLPVSCQRIHRFTQREPEEKEMEVTVAKNGPFYLNETFNPDEDIPDTGGGKGEIVRISNGKISADMEDGTRL